MGSRPRSEASRRVSMGSGSGTAGAGARANERLVYRGEPITGPATTDLAQCYREVARHAVAERHPGPHERNAVRRVDPPPAPLGHRQELEGHESSERFRFQPEDTSGEDEPNALSAIDNVNEFKYLRPTISCQVELRDRRLSVLKPASPLGRTFRPTSWRSSGGQQHGVRPWTGSRASASRNSPESTSCPPSEHEQCSSAFGDPTTPGRFQGLAALGTALHGDWSK